MCASFSSSPEPPGPRGIFLQLLPWAVSPDALLTSFLWRYRLYAILSLNRSECDL